MSQLAKLFLEPFAYRLPVYGQHQFVVISRILFHLEDIILDVKLPPVLFDINPAIAPVIAYSHLSENAEVQLPGIFRFERGDFQLHDHLCMELDVVQNQIGIEIAVANLEMFLSCDKGKSVAHLPVMDEHLRIGCTDEPHLRLLYF